MGGTGDIALRILDHVREAYGDRETCVDVVDTNGKMLKEGHTRFKKSMHHNSARPSALPLVICFAFLTGLLMGRPAAPQIAFIEGNARAPPSDRFPDNTHDLYTIAFVIQNVTSIPDDLCEAHRVLKPGGVCLPRV